MYKRQLVGPTRTRLDTWRSSITSQFYLTLDADIICTRTVRYSDLIGKGRTLSDKGSHDIHRRWYERAAEVLGLPMYASGWHNLTLALLSREAVIMLQKHLASRVHPALISDTVFPSGAG